MLDAFAQESTLATAEAALDVFHFEAAARKVVPPAHWGYMASGVDGGVRRGTDVFKALALGASAVGIGRPYIWGLSAFGQPGVERVLDIVNSELRLAMVGCGTRSLKEITSASIIDTGRRG